MRRTKGFTLIELVMVIVLLAIVATISVQFVALSTRGALDVSARQQRALQNTVISEQIIRELREAFPLSIRVAGGCIEWLPVEAVTNYAALTTAPGFDDISIAAFSTVPLVGSTRVVVYGYGSPQASLYGNGNPGPVSPRIAAGGIASNAITLSAGHRFGSHSPEQRLYVINTPVSLCQSGRFLYRYSDYGRATTQPVSFLSSATREVLSANLLGSVDFSVAPPTLKRAGVVQFTFTLQDYDTGSGETTTVSQEVQIRNVP
ncbi:type II secretion system protein [Marinobacter caseinilyticus]|uniref:type II secretion system protein n=1 Tax=Marinobacter caseinilyticus TaxID=2692195 RepID=UPI00140E5297|nr:type II secretion system protein [Marinobacter caseinilyticus]